ncbi:FitA-like ribbon-helix-helix domain-containing protein [Dankookia sp. P2]|uniref:FitA-like ribbon-helix-helix domain-containing protein n=1 Tax=Dankookia sp. P2 TaxID=3423955 RepID=UPI003D675A50
MAQVLVRQLDDAVVERVKRKAAAAGTSLEGYVRDLITRDAQDDRAALIEKLRALRAAQPRQTSDSTETIRRWRDGERDDD